MSESAREALGRIHRIAVPDRSGWTEENRTEVISTMIEQARAAYPALEAAVSVAESVERREAE